MAEKKAVEKVEDFTDVVKGLTGLVGENYLNGFEFTLSLWEENMKLLNAQLDKWVKAEKDYTDSAREVYEKFPREVASFWNGNAKVINQEIDRYVTLQKEYVDSVRSLSDRVAKDSLNFTQKNVERTFAFFDGYLRLFRA